MGSCFFQLNDFDYHLPPDLIARYPLPERSDSRLLCLEGLTITHHSFGKIVDLVSPGDLMVFNDTKVIPARLMGKKSTGGKVEVLVERILNDHSLLAQIHASKSPRTGDALFFETEQLTIVDRQQQFYELRYDHPNKTVLQFIESIGEIPLPPYLHRPPERSDEERYQTIYAKHKGSVAAPTAGLHFDENLLKSLREKEVDLGYLTLHIGAGTFSPVRSVDLSDHTMHAEYITVTEALCKQIQVTKSRGKRVIAVGTTTVRALETASQSGVISPYEGDTRIFIYPGYTFRCVDALVTNMHLPRSTLLMLVCALGGYREVMQAYQQAVQQGYRFYSYGDAMWINKIKK